MSELPKKQSLARWQELDRRRYLHPITDHRQPGEKGTRVIARAEDVYILDSEGHRILDGMAGPGLRAS